MSLSKQSILENTRQGLDIYKYILETTYNQEVDIDSCSIGTVIYRNPFNQDKETLWIRTDGKCSYHLDIDLNSEQGDVFEFAKKYYGLSGESLLNRIQNDVIRFPCFSFYKKPIRSVRPVKTMNVLDVFNLISSGTYKEATEELRAIPKGSEAKKFKASNFDYVTFSGVFRSRSESNLLEYSGLIVIDFDHLLNLDKTRNQLINDPELETELLFVSPSGDGLKWVVNVGIDVTEHSPCFTGITNYLRETYQLDIDPSGKDVSRACFLPYDPNPFINPKYN